MRNRPGLRIASLDDVNTDGVGNRIGRPPGRKPMVNLRGDQELLDQIKDAATQAGRPVAEEIIKRLWGSLLCQGSNIEKANISATLATKTPPTSPPSLNTPWTYISPDALLAAVLDADGNVICPTTPGAALMIVTCVNGYGDRLADIDRLEKILRGIYGPIASLNRTIRSDTLKAILMEIDAECFPGMPGVN